VDIVPSSSVTLKSGNEFILYEYLGIGNESVVFKGLDCQTNNLVAIKFERTDAKLSQLGNERKALLKLTDCPDVPHIIDYSLYENYKVLVTDKIGYSLEKVKSKLPITTVLKIGFKTLRILRNIHKHGILHRDVKPSNIIVMPNWDITLIDFGLSEIPNVCDKFRTCYTLSYGSLASIEGGFRLSYDDLESLAYTLMSLLLGGLPWDKMKEKQLLKAKQNINWKSLYQQLPSVLVDFLKYSRNCRSRTDEPDYQTWIEEFRTAYKNEKRKEQKRLSPTNKNNIKFKQNKKTKI